GVLGAGVVAVLDRGEPGRLLLLDHAERVVLGGRDRAGGGLVASRPTHAVVLPGLGAGGRLEGVAGARHRRDLAGAARAVGHVLVRRGEPALADLRREAAAVV